MVMATIAQAYQSRSSVNVYPSLRIINVVAFGEFRKSVASCGALGTFQKIDFSERAQKAATWHFLIARGK